MLISILGVIIGILSLVILIQSRHIYKLESMVNCLSAQIEYENV